MSGCSQSPLPAGWVLRRIGDILGVDGIQVDSTDEDFSKLQFLGLENIESGTRQFVIPEENGETAQSACWRFGPKHVLYGKLRPYLNKVYLPNDEGRCSLEILPLLPKNGFNRDFAAAVLQSPEVLRLVTQHSTGGRMPRADIRKLLALELCIPATVDECNKLGDEFSQILRGCVSMRRAAHRQAEASDAFELSLLRQCFDTPAAAGWQRTKLGDMADLVMGQSPDGSTYNKTGNGLPLLNGPTEFGDDHPTPAQWTTNPKKRCQPDDLLLCVRGNTTGRMNRADQVYALGRGVAAIRGKTGKGHTRFIRHAIHYRLAKLLVGSGRSTFPNIGKDDIVPFEVYAPADVNEQEQFALVLDAKLSQVRSLQAVAGRQVDAVRALPGATLRQFFNLT